MMEVALFGFFGFGLRNGGSARKPKFVGISTFLFCTMLFLASG